MWASDQVTVDRRARPSQRLRLSCRTGLWRRAAVLCTAADDLWAEDRSTCGQRVDFFDRSPLTSSDTVHHRWTDQTGRSPRAVDRDTGPDYHRTGLDAGAHWAQRTAVQAGSAEGWRDVLGMSLTVLLRRAVLAAVGTVVAAVLSAALAGALRLLLGGVAIVGVIVLFVILTRLYRRASRGSRL